jgi:DNA polymerase I-like protein with 3'-5' exonuclease and polymerase domains
MFFVKPPETEWVMPTEIPDLRGAKEFCIDLETYDPNLKTKGSGWPTKDGHVVGVAIAVEGLAIYLPIRHGKGDNFPPSMVLNYMKDLCSDPEAHYIFHNAQYDVGWLRAEGVEVKGTIIDTMIAAPLLDENRFSYALNSLGKDYLFETKDERMLRDAAKEFGLDPKAELHLLPAMYVGKYAEQDAALTLRLWNHFKGMIQNDGLEQIFEVESQILRIAIDMRTRGVRIDLEKTESAGKDLVAKEREIIASVKKEYGIDVDIWAAASVAKGFDKLGLEYNRTAKGQPSFTKDFLKNHEHPFAQSVVKARELNKAHSTFIETILRHQNNGRLHPEMHQLRSDDGGTVTGRFSYSNPNLQQIPSRDQNISSLIRSLFLPEKGETWGSFDYASQEPRLVVHYAKSLDLGGSDEFVHAFLDDPRTDFHQLAADLMGVSRKEAKTIGLGLIYGMGVNKLSHQLGVDLDEAKGLSRKYHQNIPFLKELADKCSGRASRPPYLIRTLLHRRCRFPMWEPVSVSRDEPVRTPYNREKAEQTYGPNNIKVAFAYKALNRLIQGSAADQTKMAMVELHKEGLLPLVQIHDELAMSVPDRDTAHKVREIMESCVRLHVPSVVDMECGPNWGSLKEGWFDPE